jgi:hypothetical protein
VIRQNITDYEDVMTFGKYKGKTVEWIWEHNLEYLIWLVDEGVVKMREEMYEAACLDDADNSPPESWFFPDLGSK